jgi:leader peptidase (prepilin peptidase)/N-methyltransferase
MMQLHGIAEIFSLLVGLCVGSFLNVCIARMPEDRSVVSPPSHCPACGSGIRPWDNIPLLSWVFLRGRCRDCGISISVLYPIIELMTGLMFWVLFHRFIPGPEALTQGHFLAYGLICTMVAMLIGQTFIDVRHFIIPNEFSIYAAPVGIVGMWAVSTFGVDYAVIASGWQDAAVGSVLGGGSLALIMGSYWLFRREEGMGMGDVKLLMMIGAFLGALPAIPFVLIVSSLAGAVVGLPMAFLGKKGLRVAMPFGPFLAFGAILYVLHGPEIIARFFPGVSFLLQAS